MPNNEAPISTDGDAGPAGVWLEDARPGRSNMGLPSKVSRLFDRAGFSSLFEPGELVAIKVHFGEPGNTTYISPVLIRKVVDKVKEYGGRPFVTDANTIYVGRRANSVDHINAAIENGFAYSVVGAPIIIADGLRGHDYVRVPVNGRHFDEVKIGSAVVHADSLITLSHLKGHMLAGFGGAFKNIGMGLGSRAGKREMHSDGLPIVKDDRCIACGKCLAWCPVHAMSLAPRQDVGTTTSAAAAAAASATRTNIDPVQIDQTTCISCGECAASCPYGAIGFDWKTDPLAFQEKMVEYTKGVLSGKEGKCGFITFLMNMTPDCDCLSWSGAPLLRDVGIVAGKNIVAVEQASLDLAKEAFDGVDPFQAHNGIDGTRVITYATELGLGIPEYTLKRIST